MSTIRALTVIAVLAVSMSAPPAGAQAPVTQVSTTLRAQILLDRIGFSSGEIDGRAGVNLKHAVEAFQRAHELKPTGTIDQATLTSLGDRAGTGPVLVMYAITEADVAGPFEAAIPKDLMEQSRLAALAYTSPLEALAEKFHTSAALMKVLNPAATFGAGESILVPDVTAPAVADASSTTSPASIVVTKATSALTVEDADGHVLFHAPVTTGSMHDPLPLGTWKVTGVRRNPEFFYNPALFWDADRSHSKARIAPGPNNPVGVVWIDISRPHYGIHGTPEPSLIGHVQSHGCVRLTNWDAEKVAQWARPGMRVVFR